LMSLGAPERSRICPIIRARKLHESILRHLGANSMAEPYKGFGELKRHYPSAEYHEMEFTLKGEPAALLALHVSHAGKINDAEFRGHPAVALFFLGPNAGTGKPTASLCFVKRPEGWNTAYRQESGQWEEIRHTETGKAPYEAVDFRPLARLINDSE
jgi:hypothetical protein